MFSSRRLIIGFALLLVATLACFAIPHFREAKRAAADSAQRALMAEAVGFLKAYHAEHGRYPESLDEFRFTYPDGSDESILATLKYRTDGARYTIIAKSLWDGSDLHACQ